MPRIYIDNKAYHVKEGLNLLDAVLSLGINLPYFCWHPRLGSVGACRQCAVKQFRDEKDDKGKLIMACMNQVEEDMRISVHDEEAEQFRAGIIEGLMINHPHDCPTCDEGGECHLQDMTVMTGHNYRRYSFDKRTFHNQYLGPFINHEMNRCITCYRCVRFYKDFAGGKDLDAFGAHDRMYFGREKDGILESEFSGNLVEICPTGVFTDKTLKNHYTRKWDFTFTPSVCNLCSLGCNTIAGERYGQIRRIKNRYHEQVNGYFICDRGRFGYEYLNSGERMSEPFFKKENNTLQGATVDEIISLLKDIFSGNKKITGIGSGRASLESNFALQKLAGKENFYAGITEKEYRLNNLAVSILSQSRSKIYSMKETERADAVLILGEDLTNTAPMLALAVRQSVRNQPMKKLEKLKIPQWDDKAAREAIQNDLGPLYIFNPVPGKLDPLSRVSLHVQPSEIAEMGFAVAHFIEKSFALPPNLNKEKKNRAQSIARALLDAEDPVVISGTSCMNENVLKAAANIAEALSERKKKHGLTLVFREANSVGLSLLEARNIKNLTGKAGEEGILVVLENELEEVEKLAKSFEKVIVLDYINHQNTEIADILLPTAPVPESDGHLVNNEGRVQRFFRVTQPQKAIQPAWRWIQALADAAGIEDLASMGLLEDYSRALEQNSPVFKNFSKTFIDPAWRGGASKIARESHRYSGRTAMHANESLYEPVPPHDEDSPMTFSMEGFHGYPPAPLTPFYWSPGWNSVQSLNKYQEEVGGSMRSRLPELLLFRDKDVSGNKQRYSPEGAGKKSLEIIPLYLIYGSEKLSSLHGAVRERVPEPFLMLNRKTADQLKLKEGDWVSLSGRPGGPYPVRISADFPDRSLGIPVGLVDEPFRDISTLNEIEKVNKKEL